jgi:hypothetical protein
MALYQIHSPGNPGERRYAATFPEARYQFEVACYEALQAFGKLDTIAAHATMSQARARCSGGLLPGEIAELVISNTGRTVSIRRY